MLHLVIFYLVQTAVSSFAAWRGGSPERIIGAAMILATMGTSFASYGPGLYRTVNWMQLYVDLAFLGALIAVAARAARYWPLYIAGLHLLGVGVHGVRAYDPAILPIIYSRAAVAVAYPMLALLVIGTVRHAARAKRDGPAERDWSTFRW